MDKIYFRLKRIAFVQPTKKGVFDRGRILNHNQPQQALMNTSLCMDTRILPVSVSILLLLLFFVITLEDNSVSIVHLLT